MALAGRGMNILRNIHRFIPGFRQLKSNSMIIAATYYGAALFITLKYWHWGLALLALPFLVFSLIGMNASRGRRALAAVAIAAGAVVLLGTVCGAAAGGARAPRSAHTEAAAATPSAAPETRAAQTAALAPAPAADDTDAPQYAYAASKNGAVFHRPDCPDVQRIKPENVIGFKTREEAAASGRAPCKHCNP
jgi:hypothetical protein